MTILPVHEQHMHTRLRAECGKPLRNGDPKTPKLQGGALHHVQMHAFRWLWGTEHHLRETHDIESTGYHHTRLPTQAL